MKKALVAMCIGLSFAAFAGSHLVNGYVKQDGTYVAPTYATNPNGTKLDNYSTKGNVNPYTGKEGTVDPYGQSQPRCTANSYGQVICK
ncbi:hypothetical protein [Rhodoferax sp. GW822-FHT02A01]|uniref:hypothetical protein n=1 Tax=Rhodoferax sp. GW822-FHT02A01 TaxID=3141537 RepID=UPI00315D85B9